MTKIKGNETFNKHNENTISTVFQNFIVSSMCIIQNPFIDIQPTYGYFEAFYEPGSRIQGKENQRGQFCWQVSLWSDGHAENYVYRCCHAISSIMFRWISLEINMI